jgi:hypothetical protein
MEIRCVAGRLGAWEIISSHRCCVFSWESIDGVGVIFIEAGHCARCLSELQWYAVERGYLIREAPGRRVRSQTVTCNACGFSVQVPSEVASERVLQIHSADCPAA